MPRLQKSSLDTFYYSIDKDEGDALLGLVQEYSSDIGMEFGMDKCAVLGIKNGKRVECEGVMLPSGDVMKDVDEGGYKYLGVLQNEVQMSKEMKEKMNERNIFDVLSSLPDLSSMLETLFEELTLGLLE